MRFSSPIFQVFIALFFIVFSVFIIFERPVLADGTVSLPPKSVSLQSEAVVKKSNMSLVMIEEHGCPYCQAWMRDVGSFYHKTSEGKFAPLERVDIGEVKKKFNLNIHFAPTFVVMKNGKEVGRLIGYISDDFFWPKLDNILNKYGFKGDKKPS